MKTQRQRFLSQLEYARRQQAMVRCECSGNLAKPCPACKVMRVLVDLSVELVKAEQASQRDLGKIR